MCFAKYYCIISCEGHKLTSYYTEIKLSNYFDVVQMAHTEYEKEFMAQRVSAT